MTVVSRLHTAMQMKPVRSSFLRPARSIRKNLEGKKQTRRSSSSEQSYGGGFLWSQDLVC